MNIAMRLRSSKSRRLSHRIGQRALQRERDAAHCQDGSSVGAGPVDRPVGPSFHGHQREFPQLRRDHGGSHGVSQDRDDWARCLPPKPTSGAGAGSTKRAGNSHVTASRHSRSIPMRRVLRRVRRWARIIIPGVAILGENIYEPTARDNWRATVEHRQSSVDPTCSRQAHRSPTSISGRARRSSSAVRSRSRRCRQSRRPLAGISSLDAFALGLPALYVQGFGNSAGPFAYQELAVRTG